MSGYSYDPNRPAESQHAPSPSSHAPSAPLLPPIMRTDSIENYKPKSHTAWYIGGGVLLILIVVAAILINNIGATPPVESESPARTPTATDTRTGGVPFKDSEVSGYWKITKTTWSAGSVTVAVEIQVDEGTLYYQFYAFAHNDESQHEPTPTKPTDLSPGFAGPGQVVVGTLTFNVDRQPLTLVIAGQGYTQLSALPIED